MLQLFGKMQDIRRGPGIACLATRLNRLKYPEPLINVNKFELSPLTEALIEARFLGPDPAVLDSLTGVAIDIMRRNPKVTDARNEWGNMTYMIRPVYDPVKAGFLGITKANLMESVKSIEEGTVIGIYRDEEKKVPVLLKSEKSGIRRSPFIR